jgi:hypothetical protein
MDFKPFSTLLTQNKNNWREKERRTLEELFPNLEESKKPKKDFESFLYELQLDKTQVTFRRDFRGTNPLSIITELRFRYKMQILLLNMGLFENPNYISFESRNWGITIDGKTYTDLGREIINDLFKNRERIISIPGLRKEDKSSLYKLLKNALNQYNENRLIPNSYTI